MALAIVDLPVGPFQGGGAPELWVEVLLAENYRFSTEGHHKRPTSHMARPQTLPKLPQFILLNTSGCNSNFFRREPGSHPSRRANYRKTHSSCRTDRSGIGQQNAVFGHARGQEAGEAHTTPPQLYRGFSNLCFLEFESVESDLDLPAGHSPAVSFSTIIFPSCSIPSTVALM